LPKKILRFLIIDDDNFCLVVCLLFIFGMLVINIINDLRREPATALADVSLITCNV
jgi:hypothetical protein